jgi:hypothetical protein
LRKRFHRVLNTWDLDVDSSVSNYSADWKGGKKIQTYNSNFFLDHVPLIFSRSGYLNSSFFINFTDPRKVLFTEKFFQYKASVLGHIKYIDLSKCFALTNKNYYCRKTYSNFYNNLLLSFFNLHKGYLLRKLKLYHDAYKKNSYFFCHLKGLGNLNFCKIGLLSKNLDCLSLLNLTHSSFALRDFDFYNVTKKKGFSYKPSNILYKNLIFKFYFYSSWVAKRFFRITHWFNLNAYSLKHKNQKHDFKFMAGYRVKNLGRFLK